MRLAPITAVALLALAVTACGRETAAPSPASQQPEQQSQGPRPVATTAAPAAPEAPADPFVLVVLGDSFAAGDELPPDATLSAQLARQLADNGVAAQVLDASAPGDSASVLARFENAVAAEADAVVIALGGDDLARAAAPAEVEAALAGVIERAQARGLWVGLVGLEAPLGGGASDDPGYIEAFNDLYAELASSHRVRLYPDFFSGLVDHETGETRAELFLADGVHPTDLGVAIIAEGLADWLADALPREARARPAGG